MPAEQHPEQPSNPHSTHCSAPGPAVAPGRVPQAGAAHVPAAGAGVAEAGLQREGIHDSQAAPEAT